MAKRKRYGRRARSSFGSFKFRRRNSGSSTGSLMATVVGAAAYGAMREKVSTAIAPYTSKIPLGTVSDEVGMGLLLIIADKTIGKKMPILRGVIKGGIIVESARIGEAIIQGNVMGKSSSNNANLLG